MCLDRKGDTKDQEREWRRLAEEDRYRRYSEPICDCEEPSQDHAEDTANLWRQAFWQAMQVARVEILRDMIKKNWGKNMEETAKTVLESMYKEWQEAQKKEEEAAKGKAPEETETFKKIKETVKKGMKKGPQ